jgi:hypothetical protein
MGGKMFWGAPCCAPFSSFCGDMCGGMYFLLAKQGQRNHFKRYVFVFFQ